MERGVPEQDGRSRDGSRDQNSHLLLGHEKTEQAKPMLFKEWAKVYLEMETVKGLRSFVGRSHSINTHLIPFFGQKILSEIKPQDVEVFRSQRKKPNGSKASTQTINHDHVALKHCLNMAIKRGLLQVNPALTSSGDSSLFEVKTPRQRRADEFH
jgi:hypothetical protein